MVFSKSGFAGFFATASISFRFEAIAASRAGLKSATLTLSNGGTPPYGPVHFSSRTLSAFRGVATSAAVAAATRSSRVLGMGRAPYQRVRPGILLASPRQVHREGRRVRGTRQRRIVAQSAALVRAVAVGVEG